MKITLEEVLLIIQDKTEASVEELTNEFRASNTDKEVDPEKLVSWLNSQIAIRLKDAYDNGWVSRRFRKSEYVYSLTPEGLDKVNAS